MHDQKALGPMLGQCAHLTRERMDARMSRFGMTPSQTHVLLYLRQRGGQVSQCELTAHMRVKPSTVNGILDRLEEKGLVGRTVSGADARQRLVTLTPAGVERESQTKQCFQEAEALITRGLTEEETEMLRTRLGQVIHNLEEDRTV